MRLRRALVLLILAASPEAIAGAKPVVAYVDDEGQARNQLDGTAIAKRTFDGAPFVAVKNDAGAWEVFDRASGEPLSKEQVDALKKAASDFEKVERTDGIKNPTAEVKLWEKKPPVYEVTEVPKPPAAPKDLPSPQPYRPKHDYAGPVPYMDDNGRLRNVYDHTFLSKADAEKAPWFAQKNPAWDGISKTPFDVIEKDTKRVLSRGLVVDPAREKYFEAKAANGGKVPKVEVPEPRKEEKPAPPEPAKPRKLSYNSHDRLPEEEKKSRDKLFDKPKNQVEIYSWGGTKKAGFDVEAIGMKDGEIPIVPENSVVNVKLKVAQAEGTGVAKVRAGKEGVDVNAYLEGKVYVLGVQAETGKASVGDDRLGASAYARFEAAVLAEAKANGNLKVGKDGVKLGAEAGAFAGGKVKVEVPVVVKTGGVETRTTATAELTYGIGAEGKAYLYLENWKLKTGVKGQVTLGVGGGAAVDIEISVKDLVDQIAPPETPGIAALQQNARVIPPLANRWTLTDEEYKTMATALLTADGDRAKAKGELKKLEDHWVAGLADWSDMRKRIDADPYDGVWERLRQDLYMGRPEAIRGAEAAIAAHGAGGSHRIEDMRRAIRLGTPIRGAPRAVDADYSIPQTHYEYKGYVLPSYQGVRGIDDPAILMGIANWWAWLPKTERDRVNRALSVLPPDKQVGLLKDLAEREIGVAVNKDGWVWRGEVDEEWADHLLGNSPATAPVMRVLRETYSPAARRVLAAQIAGMGGERYKLLSNEIGEMILADRPASADTIARTIFNRAMNDANGRAWRRYLNAEALVLEMKGVKNPYPRIPGMSMGLIIQAIKDDAVQNELRRTGGSDPVAGASAVEDIRLDWFEESGDAKTHRSAFTKHGIPKTVLDGTEGVGSAGSRYAATSGGVAPGSGTTKEAAGAGMRRD